MRILRRRGSDLGVGVRLIIQMMRLKKCDRCGSLETSVIASILSENCDRYKIMYKIKNRTQKADKLVL